MDERLALFIQHCDQVKADHFKAMKYDWKAPTHELRRGDKWARVMIVEYDNDGKPRPGAVYAFVALIDHATKNLGTIKAGDIHKPASWAAPAKHARGNIFDVDFGNCCGPYGINYLR